MTVATTTSRVAYTGDGVTVAFAVPFPFFDASDLLVIERTIADGAEATKTLNVDYTVAGGGGSTGTVTAGSAPGATVQWVILRATPLTQLIDYVSNDGFPAETHEDGLDRAAMRDQEVQEKLDRTLKFPIGDADTLDPALPSSVDRAGKVLGFDANGNPVAVEEIPEGSVSLPLAIADGGTGASSASAARTALAVPGLASANVFTANQTIRSTDAGSGGGPKHILDRASASPAASDFLGGTVYRGRDAGGNETDYAEQIAEIVDPADGSEDGILSWFIRVAGSFGRRMWLGAGLVVGTPTGGDPGAGWINVSGGFKVNNVAIGSGSIAGQIVQRTHTRHVTYDSTTTVIPYDDSAPQSGEGKAIVTHQHTPQASANRLIVRVVAPMATSQGQYAAILALFKDSETSARAAACFRPVNGGGQPAESVVVLEYEMAAGTTSAIDFKLRYGSANASGTAAINGNSSGRLFGGIAGVTITVEELKV